MILCATILIAGIGYSAWRYVQPEHYGNAFAGAPEASLHDLTQQAALKQKLDVRVEGRIVRQCPATGCWFYLDDGKGNQVKVEMAQVTPELPQRIGRRAVVEGRMVMMGDEPVLAGNGVEFKR
jgi:hypothetical protein